jgi:hypothetical protein
VQGAVEHRKHDRNNRGDGVERTAGDQRCPDAGEQPAKGEGDLNKLEMRRSDRSFNP